MGELTTTQELPKTREGLIGKLGIVLRKLAEKRRNKTTDSQEKSKYIVPPDPNEIRRKEKEAIQQRRREIKMKEAGELKARHLQELQLRQIRQRLKSRV